MACLRLRESSSARAKLARQPSPAYKLVLSCLGLWEMVCTQHIHVCTSGSGNVYLIAFHALLKMYEIRALKSPMCPMRNTSPAFPVFLLSLAQQSTPLHSLAVVRCCIKLLLYFCQAGAALLLLPRSEHRWAWALISPRKAAGAGLLCLLCT